MARHMVKMTLPYLHIIGSRVDHFFLDPTIILIISTSTLPSYLGARSSSGLWALLLATATNWRKSGNRGREWPPSKPWRRGGQTWPTPNQPDPLGWVTMWRNLRMEILDGCDPWTNDRSKATGWDDAPLSSHQNTKRQEPRSVTIDHCIEGPDTDPFQKWVVGATHSP